MSRGNQISSLLAAIILTSAVSVTAQVNSQNRSTMNVNNRSADNSGPVVYGGYQIGVGDVLDIHVNDEDDISGKYQVDQDGKVKISLLPNAIQAAGSTTFEFASRKGTNCWSHRSPS